MAEIPTAPPFVVTLQTGGMHATGATSGSNRPLEQHAYDVFEVA
jgi:hypothetical protein